MSNDPFAAIASSNASSSSADAPKNKGFLPAGLRWAGPFLACAYGCGVRLHRTFSTPRWAPITTLCIGNLTVGGTGKTPTAKYIAERLARRGYHPAVLMRGYKEQSNDEAKEVQNALHEFDVPVILGSDRYASALEAKARGCDVVLLDDGFQHWNLNRDLDIVLIDAGSPFGGGHLIPNGRLREPLSALSRSGAIIVTRADSVSEIELHALCKQLQEELLQADIPIAITTHAPSEVRVLNPQRQSQKKLTVGDLLDIKLSAVCGLGRPEVFRNTLLNLGAKVVSFSPQPDHAFYTAESLHGFIQEARHSGAEALIVTEKDAVKIEPLIQEIQKVQEIDFPIWMLAVKLKFLSGEAQLWKKIATAMDQNRGLLLRLRC
jgi:tetraacyldisaccharide 4'-kinase